MDEDVLDILEQLGYTGPLVEAEKLQAAVNVGAKSVEYTELVQWLSKELKALCKLDDHVNAISSADDSSSFLLEVSSFLKELNCPHEILMKDNVNQRLQTVESRLLLLVYLGSEVQAARIISVNEAAKSKVMQVGVSESPTASDLKSMMKTLSISKPPDNITAAQLFSKLEDKIKERLNALPAEVLKKPLFSGLLSPQQWHSLAQLYKEMFEDYKIRREMLLKRVDVTIQSFQWSGKAKQSKDKIARQFGPLRQQLKIEPKVTIADLLAAREDLSILEKTSSSSVRKNTQCAINKVIIGRVPDRGGRPNEQKPPPPEMPSWQKRTDSGPGGGRGGGGSGRGGGRGGRVQGGWNQQGGGGYQQDQGGYQQGGGGGYQQGGGGGYQQGGGGYQQGGGGYQQGGGGYQQGGGGYQQGGGGYQQGGSGYLQDHGGYQQGGGGRGGRGRGGHQGGRHQDYHQGGDYGGHQGGGYGGSNQYQNY